MVKIEIVRHICDGCGLVHETEKKAFASLNQADLPPGWSGWTATDWRRHGDAMRGRDLGEELPADTSVMLEAHTPECAKLAFGKFVDRSVAEWPDQFERGTSAVVALGDRPESETMVGVPI